MRNHRIAFEDVPRMLRVTVGLPIAFEKQGKPPTLSYSHGRMNNRICNRPPRRYQKASEHSRRRKRQDDKDEGEPIGRRSRLPYLDCSARPRNVQSGRRSSRPGQCSTEETVFSDKKPVRLVMRDLWSKLVDIDCQEPLPDM